MKEVSVCLVVSSLDRCSTLE